MAIIFDGKMFAAKIEEEIRQKVATMDFPPKLVSIYNSNDKASRIYTNIKEKKASELGIKFEKYDFNNSDFQTISKLIMDLNEDKTVTGIMIQLPFPDSEKLIELIDSSKDVDGLKVNSLFLSATVRSVIKILEYALESPIFNLQDKDIMVVGSNGEVGSRLIKELKAINPQMNIYGIDKEDFDVKKIKTADVVISCTGQEALIKPEMVKHGVICIDVGFPKGDFEPEVVNKASFFTPVPGGVGPVTVAMLFMGLL